MQYFDDEKGDSISVDFSYQNKRYVYKAFKRVFDFFASLIGLILLSPLFLIVAIESSWRILKDQYFILKFDLASIRKHLRCINFDR